MYVDGGETFSSRTQDPSGTDDKNCRRATFNIVIGGLESRCHKTYFVSDNMMGWLSPKYYVYVIVSLRGLYVGKGCGDRVRESMKERHGLFYLILSRSFTQKSAYRSETRTIRMLRSMGVPLQNGRAPRRGIWASMVRRRKKSRKSSGRLSALVFWVVVFWWITK